MPIDDDMVKECESVLLERPLSPGFYMGIPLHCFSREALVQIACRAIVAAEEAALEEHRNTDFLLSLTRLNRNAH